MYPRGMGQRYRFRFPGTAHPLWSSGSIEPYGSEGMKALRWIGHSYGPGGLILFAGYAYGLFARRTVVQDTEVAAEPQRQRRVTAGT